MPKGIYKSHVYSFSFYMNKSERELEQKYVDKTEYYNALFRKAVKGILAKY